MCASKRQIEWCNSHPASYYSSLANWLYVKRVRLELTSRTCIYPFSVSFLVRNAKTTKQLHAKRGVNLLLDWPVNSPDCNPIEKAKTCMRHEQPTSIEWIKKNYFQGLGGNRPVVFDEALWVNATPYAGCDCCRRWLYQVLNYFVEKMFLWYFVAQ